MESEVSKLGKLYISTVDKNLQSMKKIIEDIHVSDSIPACKLNEMLNASSCNLTDKWKSSRKSLRTEIALKTIPEYPPNALQVSLIIDSMINLLDDSLDELMTKQQRALYVIELVRTLAVFNQYEISKESRKKISEYFNKILVIAITEILYEEKIKASDEFRERLDFSIQCYDCKCLVTDIFFELPLIELYGNDEAVKGIISLARIHRALFQVIKDSRDLERDIKNQTETPVVILFNEDEILDKYLDAMIEHYLKESTKFKPADFKKELQPIAKKLLELITEEATIYRKERA